MNDTLEQIKTAGAGPEQRDIWTFQESVSRRLQAWGGISVLGGAVLWLVGGPFWRGFGIQSAVWGAIDAGIALAGRRGAAKRRADPDADQSATRRREARNLRRLLWINTGLDVLYMLGGALLAITKGSGRPHTRGHGWGIVVQGAFLFVFDLFHALVTPQEN